MPRHELRISLAVRHPVRLRHVWEELVQRPEQADAVAERLYHRMRSGGGTPCAFSHPITGLRSTPIFSISASITSPGLQVERSRVLREAGHAGNRACGDDVARAVPERRIVREDLRDRHAHVSRVRALPRLAVHAQLHREVVRVADLVRGDDPRPERAEGVDRLAEGEDARLHLAPLDVARRDVVEDHVAADVVLRLVRAEPLARLADDDRELELVVELLGQVLGVDDRIVRADDRVDVLEEDDPGRDLVRPADALRLLLVLAEVAGGVEELLGDDRRAQADIGERILLARRARNLVPLEQLPHRAGVELDDPVALDPTDLALIEGGKLHRRRC